LIKGGYLGRVLRVNLTTKEAREERLSEEFMVKYVGGRGWASRIIWDESLNVKSAFDPDNKLIVMTGPLTGLMVPGACKVTVASISPATGIYGDSNVGGLFGVQLKQAGFDGVIIEGVSEKPVYLWINRRGAELRSAEHLWGKGSLTTESMLKKELGDNSVSMLTIGPAGENLVAFACITCDYGNQAGRTGMGAVMGAKRLKAIAVKGEDGIPVADPATMEKLYTEALDYLKSKDELRVWWDQGLMQVIEWAQEASCLPTHNFQLATFIHAKRIGGEAISKAKIRDVSCYLCPMACKKLVEAKGKLVIGPEYETAVFLGSNVGLSSLEDVAYANWLCDELGMDTISAGSLIAFAMECWERGLLRDDQVEGLDLSFGNAETVFKLLEMMAHREGLGAVLADGVKEAAKRIGGDSERYALHVKGLEVSGYDVRAAPAMALAYATADIGAHHNRAWAITYDLKVGRDKYTEDKVKWVIYLQHVRPLFDCLGVCRLPWVELGLDLRFYEKFYVAATGIQVALEELLKASERIYNLTRAIGGVRGVAKKDDSLPRRFFEDPIPEGPLKGAKLSREKFNQMLTKYYELRGWDPETGLPTRAKLIELGLEDVADKLYGGG